MTHNKDYHRVRGDKARSQHDRSLTVRLPGAFDTFVRCVPHIVAAFIAVWFLMEAIG